MKVKLLNRGYFRGFENVSFPVVVTAVMREGLAYVPESELSRIGCDMSEFKDAADPFWPFFVGEECEVVE
jgi:hypothetical protein